MGGGVSLERAREPETPMRAGLKVPWQQEWALAELNCQKTVLMVKKKRVHYQQGAHVHACVYGARERYNYSQTKKSNVRYG